MAQAAMIDDAAAVVQRQLDAYNRRDLAALLACYAEDAVQYEFPGRPLAQGRAAIAERMAARFQDPRLHARLRQRSAMGRELVIDEEEITRCGADGGAAQRVGLVAIYRVRQGLIREAVFAFEPAA